MPGGLAWSSAGVEALLSVQDAALLLGTPVRFVRRLIAERRIAFYRVGRYVRLRPADLEAYVSRGRVAPMDRAGSERAG
jgi:excisionase family DNA binding protein